MREKLLHRSFHMILLSSKNYANRPPEATRMELLIREKRVSQVVLFDHSHGELEEQRISVGEIQGMKFS